MDINLDNSHIYWCKNCLNASTRPRISFNSEGICNACLWSYKKKKINWNNRLKKFYNLIKKSNTNNKYYDCLIPVSGGKDGSYVSYNIKNKLGFNPLTVTIRPSLETELGNKNLYNFVSKGYEHIHISPDLNLMNKLNKAGLINKGLPYYGWLIAIHTAVIRIAEKFNINLIVYGEDGELEYGGTKETEKKNLYNIDYIKKVYLEGGYENTLDELKKNTKNKNHFLFEFPDSEASKNLFFTHWSYFDNWDPYKNYLVAKEYCGLEETKSTNIGTFTNFAQNDQSLYHLHTYLMYLKFGFGRATQDAGIEIRRGSLDRKQGLALVKLYDGVYPEGFEQTYLEYYDITLVEFNEILDKWANKKLLYKDNKNRWKPKFEIK